MPIAQIRVIPGNPYGICRQDCREIYVMIVFFTQYKNKYTTFAGDLE